jgi:hypothetical protein
MKISFLFKNKNFWLFIACLTVALFKAQAVINDGGVDGYRLFMDGLEGVIFLFWAVMYGRKTYRVMKDLKTDG